jgi:hypothetical protein
MICEEPKSPATRFLMHVWNSVQTNKSMWSWLRLNSCMHEALSLAIKSSMDFYLDDFTYIANNFNWGRWVGDAEWVYSHAIVENNKSAIYAFEKCRKRKPFIVDTVNVKSGRIRQRERLAVGFSFLHNNSWIDVTSFNDKDNIIIACSYKPPVKDDRGYWGKREVEHIFKLTHKDLSLNRGQ